MVEEAEREETKAAETDKQSVFVHLHLNLFVQVTNSIKYKFITNTAKCICPNVFAQIVIEEAGRGERKATAVSSRNGNAHY